ncbi:hypothetical protein BDF20DRAFT_856023, partial [Mycotypha africana]|uniref:uncharacterized protein n=1 Tax=Mycotypha africana TaxID=64632 RepID=UPI002300F981
MVVTFNHGIISISNKGYQLSGYSNFTMLRSFFSVYTAYILLKSHLVTYNNMVFAVLIISSIHVPLLLTTSVHANL